MKTKLLLLAVCVFYSLSVFASEENEKLYLVQMINQLNAMKPLITAAANEQPKNARLKFHYHAFHNANGIKQNGLFEDINVIKKALQDRLSHIGTEPRQFKPIQGDYIENKTVKKELIHGD